MEKETQLSIFSNKPIDEKTDKEILSDIVIEVYIDTFKELKEKCKGKVITCMRQNIPSTKELFEKLHWIFDTKAYDVIYGVSVPSEADIANILNEKGCVFRWGGIVCNDAQLIMFELDDLGISI